jgi:hypothetical protein
MLAETTHLVPSTGHPRFRMSLCGVACAEGRLDHEIETHGRGSSTLDHVDCGECRDRAFEASGRAQPLPEAP